MPGHRVEPAPSGREDEYLYRGIVIRRDDSRRGYWGHWRTVRARFDARAKTRKELMARIDALLEQQQPREIFGCVSPTTPSSR